MRAAKKKERDGRRRKTFRPGSAHTSRSKRRPAEKSSRRFNGLSLGLGKFSAAAAERVQALRAGLPLSSFAPPSEAATKNLHLLVRRLASGVSWSIALAVQRAARTRSSSSRRSRIIGRKRRRFATPMCSSLSRFAYMRRRADEMVLESPRAGALFKICDPKIAAILATLSSPQKIKQLRRQAGFPGRRSSRPARRLPNPFQGRARPATKACGSTEGDDNLVRLGLSRSCCSMRAARKAGTPIRWAALIRMSGSCEPPPAVRPHWPGEENRSAQILWTRIPRRVSPAAKLLRERHSDARLSMTGSRSRSPSCHSFSTAAARVQSTVEQPLDLGTATTTARCSPTRSRPYPSGGGSYELELYLAVDKCEGLARGFYHYDAGAHALVPIDVRANELEAHVEGG